MMQDSIVRHHVRQRFTHFAAPALTCIKLGGLAVSELAGKGGGEGRPQTDPGRQRSRCQDRKRRLI